MTAESPLSHVVNSNEADRSGNLLLMNSSHTSLIPFLCPIACYRSKLSPLPIQTRSPVF